MKDGCPKIAPMEIIPLIEVEGIHSKTEMRLAVLAQFSRSVLPNRASKGFLPAKPSSSVCQ